MRSEDADSYESLLLGAPIATCPQRVRDANPVTYARAGAPPFLIMHGLCDTTVAPHQSELLYEALAGHGNDVTLALVQGLGHGFFNRTDLDDRGGRRMTIQAGPGRHTAWSTRRSLRPSTPSSDAPGLTLRRAASCFPVSAYLICASASLTTH